jgi:short-subunit dehydrogenase
MDMSAPRAILVGNTDGIGFAATRRLLDSGWDVAGISKSPSSISVPGYEHYVADVGERGYPELIERVAWMKPLDLCVYFAGIGELFDASDMSSEALIVDVNLTGLVRTAAGVIPAMVKAGRGHFIGISSLADELLSAEAPSYHASKAGFSVYLESLALALKPTGVSVTNLRFGFVDTKMAKGDVKPLMMSVAKAVDHLEYCIRKRPARHTAPKLAIPLIKFRKIMMKLQSRRGPGRG